MKDSVCGYHIYVAVSRHREIVEFVRIVPSYYLFVSVSYC